MEQQQQQQKNNPWSETKSLDANETHIEQDTKQCVQGLPTVLADDIILQNLLKPTVDGPKKPEDFENNKNVVPLQVNFGGQETKEIDGKKIAIRDTPDGRKIQYDPNKGYVMSSWSNFELEPDTKDKFISDNKGIFIKHLTSTVIKPNDIGVGNIGADIDIKSFSSTSNSLASNAWSNVLIYKPNEKIFKYDMEQKKLVIDDDVNASTSQQQQQ